MFNNLEFNQQRDLLLQNFHQISSLINHNQMLSKQAPIQVLIDKEPIHEKKVDKHLFSNDLYIPSSTRNFLKRKPDNDEDTVSEASIKNLSKKSTSGPENPIQVTGNKVIYPFSTMQSRKKEKKKIRAKINKVVSRVHNTDCLLKKIKAKYLKFLFLTIKEETNNIDTRKFDQCAEVRNLNIHHNRHNFLNLTVAELLKKNCVLTTEDLSFIENLNNDRLNTLLNKKVKSHYQFDFLRSSYFKAWARDPIKIYQSLRGEGNMKNATSNKNCLKYPKHSKNIFKKNTESYDTYIKLLIITSCNFVFYFQNNPLKFGKKSTRLVAN